MGQPCEAGEKHQRPFHHHHSTLLHVSRTSGVRRGFAVVSAFAVFLTLSVAVRNREGPRQTPAEEKNAAGPRRCELSSGRWVYDNASHPLYREGECMFMSDQLACEKFGRKDLRYQNWRWQPRDCDLPRFDARAMLERLRGRRLVFVGDSLNRGQWVSMVCLLGSAISEPNKALETTGNLMAFKAKEYNASIEFYWAPLLVESNSDDPVNHRLPERIVRAHSIEKHAKHWTGADVLVFNSYLWWRRPGIKVLWGSFADGLYKEVKMLRGFELALRTWAEWLEFHVDASRTRIFFVTLSPTHFRGEEWGGAAGANCYNETEPIAAEGGGHLGRDSDLAMTEAVEAATADLRTRGVDVELIDVTRMSEYRKDGHPSVHRKQWEPLTQDQIDNPRSYADCIHWCLPGVPDAWNELLYAHLFLPNHTVL